MMMRWKLFLACLAGAMSLQLANPVAAQEESFEANGEVTEVDLANRTLKVDGLLMKAPDGLMATVDGARMPFFSVVRDGAVILVSGDFAGRGQAVIRNAVVDELPLGVARPRSSGGPE